MPASAPARNTVLPSRSAIPRFPVRTTALVVVLTFGVAGWQLWSAQQIERSSKAALDSGIRVTRLAGRITHLDEVLTMSARLAAATGDFTWKARYDDHVSQLDEAIAEALRISPPEIRDQFDRMTNAANQRLLALESRSFALTASGHKEAALALLLDAEYQDNKRAYSQGIDAFRASLTAAVAGHEQEAEGLRTRNTGLSALGLSAVLAGWIVLLRTLLRWRSALIRGSAPEAARAASQAARARPAEPGGMAAPGRPIAGTAPEIDGPPDAGSVPDRGTSETTRAP